MAICKFCADPTHPGHGRGHDGWCDNMAPAARGVNTATAGDIGWDAMLATFKTPDERGIKVTMVPCGDLDVPQFARKSAASSDMPVMTGCNNVVIGIGSSTGPHSNCVLIGAGLRAERDYQLKIGNREVTASRDLTEAEFESLHGLFYDCFGHMPPKR